MLLTFRISPRRAYCGDCFDGSICPRRMGGNCGRHYIMKAFTTHCLRRSEIWKISHNSVLNLATVDVPVGMIIHTPMDSRDCILLDTVLILFMGYLYHIGVGSGVVCSTELGISRASEGGTDNKGSTLEPKCRRYYFDNQTYNNGNYMN